MKIGVLGGGQLGRMLALAGYPLGFRFKFLDPSPDAPAGHLGAFVQGTFEDEDALSALASGVDVVTYEFENVPAHAVRWLAERVPVFPGVRALEVGQDRLNEKQTFQRLGIDVGPFAPVSSPAELRDAVRALGTPCVLKTRRLGYDGKGQTVIRSADRLDQAWSAVAHRHDHAELILEAFVPFEAEASLIAARGRTGEVAFYPLTRNLHEEGILRVSTAPFASGAEHATLQAQAESRVRKLLVELDYVGVLAVEFFVVRRADGAPMLWANEMAPRVHNSGHWSIEGAVCSQFENHLRAIVGVSLGSTAMAAGASSAAAMLNFIGAAPNLADLASRPDVHIHLYGKSDRPGRKVGHCTVVAPRGLSTLGDQIAGLRGVDLSTRSRTTS